MIKNFLLLVCFIFSVSNNLFAQQLHHQMISSQASSIKTTSGLIVKQTIGQQSVSGNSKGEIIVQQGFNQSYWQKLLKDSNNPGFVISTFPNPFNDVLNFQFSSNLESSVDVSIFDSYGRSVFSQTVEVKDDLLKLVDLPVLPTAQYLVQLSGKNFKYFTLIIKI